MKTFFLPGGDARQRYLAELFSLRGFSVIRHDPKDAYSGEDFDLAIKAADIILGPVPFCTKGQELWCPGGGAVLPVERLLEKLESRHLLFGGNLPERVKVCCRTGGIACFDYMAMEEVALQNTVATAEGAIAEAMALSPDVLHGSRCLIIGYGRCGQTLAAKLSGLAARVSVWEKNEARRALAYTLGCQAASPQAASQEIRQTPELFGLPAVLSSYDFIFNTVPEPVLTAAHIFRLSPTAAVLDLASAPGGVDLEACRLAGIRAKSCPGLPGIYGPRTSAGILYHAVMQRISV